MKLIASLISAAALIALAALIDFHALREVFARAALPIVALSFFLLIVNLVLGFLRFVVMTRTYAPEADVRTLLSAFLFGQVGSLFIFSVVGQAFGRSLALSQVGVMRSAVTLVSVAERLIALGSLLLFVAPSMIYIYGGRRLNLSEGNEGLYAVLFTLFFFVIAITFVVIRRREIMADARVIATVFKGKALLAALASTLLAHAVMLAAFYMALRSLSDMPPELPVLAALSIVMFVSALPISFGGWGLRELGAIPVLGMVGVDQHVAVSVGLTIGLLSLLLVGVCAILANVLGVTPRPAPRSESKPIPVSFDSALLMLMGSAISLLILFQMRVPLVGQVTSVNFADLVAVLSLAGFGGRRLWSELLKQRRAYFAALAMISVVIGFGLLVGLLRHGVETWSLISRGVGWLVIISYALFGVVFDAARPQARRSLIRSALVASILVCVVTLTLTVAKAVGPDIPVPLRQFAVSGFVNDPNAFAFQVLVCFVLWIVAFDESATDPLARLVNCGPVLLIPAVVLTESRSGLGILVVLILASTALLGARRLPMLAASTVLALALKFLPPLVDSLGLVISSRASGFDQTAIEMIVRPASDSERLVSVRDGLKLWETFPILGSGIGGFMHERMSQGLKALVIHCVPVWLLAETGMLGTAIVGSAFAVLTALGWNGANGKRENREAWAYLLLIAVFLAGGLVHDFFYQRYFWFALGLLVPVAARHAARLPRQDAIATVAARETLEVR